MIEWRELRRFAVLLGTSLLLFAITEAPANAGAWDWATGPASRDAEDGRDWGIEIVPYAWIAGVEGDVGLPATGTIPVNATFSDLASNLDGAFAGFLDARYRRWHILVDGSWVRLRDAVAPQQPLLLQAAVESSVAFGLGGVAYELPVGWPATVEVYLGARWWHVATNASITTAGPTVSGGLTGVWVDAIVGTRVFYPITEKWRVGLTGDIGGGGASLDWQALGSLGYMFSPHFGMTVAYRILGVDYSSGGFVYDAKQSGPLLGFNLVY